MLDTNVISEARKGRLANSGVRHFFQVTPVHQRYLPVQTIGEIRHGVENLRHRGDKRQAARLEAWLGQVIRDYAGRILSFDADCAQVWGRLMSPHGKHPIDRQIASIALIHGLGVVTRNLPDFSGIGSHLLNPFT